MKYKSFNTELILAILIALPAFVVLLNGFSILYSNGFQIASLVNLGIYSSVYFSLAFLAWRNTYYKIESSILQIRGCGLLDRQIDINHIIKIERVNKRPATPTQPGLYNTNNNISGLLVRTKTGSNYFITPVKEIAFLEELRKHNPEVEIVDNRLANQQ